MQDMQETIKRLIIEALDLEDITTGDIDPQAPLFGEGLGLDSIDALELGVALRKRFQVKLESGEPDIKRYFRSVDGLVELVRERGVISD